MLQGSAERHQPPLWDLATVTEGQELARRQLRVLAQQENSALRLELIGDQPTSNGWLPINISIDCTHYKRTDEGLQLAPREFLNLLIPPDFPYTVPQVATAHRRWFGFPHVQWGRILCLHRSKDVQWNPSRGMFGFITQLDQWLGKAAVNEMVAPGDPIHPPVAYPSSNTTIVIDAGPPSWPWIGVVHFSLVKPNIWSLAGWSNLDEVESYSQDANCGARLGLAFLFNSEFSSEYPETVRDLFLFNYRKTGQLSEHLWQLLVFTNVLQEGESLLVVVGTPTRGISGELEHRFQDLQVWEIAANEVAKLKGFTSNSPEVLKSDGRRSIEETENSFSDVRDWLIQSQIRWCRVIENRPEILNRRDTESPMGWFQNKRVALWGCGAIGGSIAENLVRAGVESIHLYDSKIVTPGILVRQNFEADDILDAKSAALKRRLNGISNTVDVEAFEWDLLGPGIIKKQLSSDFDLIIDATASLSVRHKLELELRNAVKLTAVCAMLLSGHVRHGVAVLSPVDYAGGTLDVLRRLGLAASHRSWLKD